MKIHLRIDVSAGPKTPTRCICYTARLNPFEIKLKNGSKIKGEDLMDAVEQSVINFIEKRTEA